MSPIDRRRPRRPFLLGVTLLALLAVLAGACAKSDEGQGSSAQGTINVQQADGGALVFGVNAETNNWSPYFGQWAGSSYTIANAIYDPLAAYDVNGDVQPYLAQEFTSNADFTQWTIKLRPNVTFHNGTKLNAAAVVKNLETGSTQGLTAQVLGPMYSSVSAQDDMTVVVKMKQPWSTYPHILTGQPGYMQAPEQLVEPNSNDSLRKPIGTGPFRFEEWIPDQSLKAKKYPGYWNKDSSGTQLPYLDSITFRVLPDFQSRGAALESGEIDVMETSDPAQIIKFKGYADQGQYQMYTDAGQNTAKTFIVLNTATPPFNNPKAREALAYGLDTQLVSQAAYQEVFPPANSPIGDQSPYYTDPQYPKHDPERAKQLIADVERETGQKPNFTALIPPVPEYITIAQSMQAQAKELGVDVQLETVDQSTLVNRVLGGQYQASGFIWFGSPLLDRDAVFLTSDSNPPGQLSVNLTRLDNPKIKAAIAEARKTTDKQKIKEQYAIVAQEMSKDLDYIWVVQNRTAIVYRNNVHGFIGQTLPNGQPAADSVTPFTDLVWVKR
ncbi:MAG: ABC transporter substrate-binding protein [Acidimicrobiales bacterium]